MVFLPLTGYLKIHARNTKGPLPVLQDPLRGSVARAANPKTSSQLEPDAYRCRRSSSLVVTRLIAVDRRFHWPCLNGSQVQRYLTGCSWSLSFTPTCPDIQDSLFSTKTTAHGRSHLRLSSVPRLRDNAMEQAISPFEGCICF